MFDKRSLRFSLNSAVTRVGVSAILALLCLLSLVSGATQALCLDLRGGCSPSAAAAAASCHDQAHDSGFVPTSCGSCIDILIPEDAFARCNRPDHAPSPPVAAPHFLAAVNEVLSAMVVAVSPTATLLNGKAPSHSFLRTTVLLI